MTKPSPKSAAAILEDAMTWLASVTMGMPPEWAAVAVALLREVSPEMRRAVDALSTVRLREEWKESWQRAIDAVREG